MADDPQPADPARAGSRPRALAGRRPGEGGRVDPGAPGALPDLVGHRDRRPLHAGRPGRPRRGARPRPAGRVPVHARRPAHDVPRPPLDDAPVRRLRDRRGDERALPLPARAGPDRPVGRLRPADPDGLRLRRARGGGRGRPGRRADQLAGRHGGPARRHPARRRQHLDDDQRHRGRPPRPLRGRGREAGRAAGAGRAARPRTTSSRSTSPAAPTSSRRARRCAS